MHYEDGFFFFTGEDDVSVLVLSRNNINNFLLTLGPLSDISLI